MKHTEGFFKFPVRVYDRFSVIKSYEKEKDIDIPMEGEWAKGYHNIRYWEIEQWVDFFDSEKGVEGVDREGFTETMIFTKEESFICTLSRVEFEKLLDEYVEKYLKEVPKELNM